MDSLQEEIEALYKKIPSQMINPKEHPRAMRELGKVLDKVLDCLTDIEVDLDYLVEDERDEFGDVQRELKRISEELIKTAAKFETIFDI